MVAVHWRQDLDKATVVLSVAAGHLDVGHAAAWVALPVHLPPAAPEHPLAEDALVAVVVARVLVLGSVGVAVAAVVPVRVLGSVGVAVAAVVPVHVLGSVGVAVPAVVPVRVLGSVGVAVAAVVPVHVLGSVGVAVPVVVPVRVLGPAGVAVPVVVVAGLAPAAGRLSEVEAGSFRPLHPVVDVQHQGGAYGRKYAAAVADAGWGACARGPGVDHGQDASALGSAQAWALEAVQE